MASMSKLLQAKEELSKLTPELSHSADLSLLEGLEKISMLCKYRLPIIDELQEIVDRKFYKTVGVIDRIIELIDREIKALEEDYINHSNKWVEKLIGHTYEDWQEYMNKMYNYSHETKEWTVDRISAHSNWQKAALFYMPDTLDYLQQFASYYPIYVLDKWEHTRTSIKDLIPIQQVRKTRFYNNDQIENIPSNCIGFALARNYYTHRKIEHFENDLKFFNRILGPGGTLCFNFNNCEISKCAEAVENKSRSYMIGTNLRRILWENGFEIMRWEYLDLEATMWVEVRKPGEFSSIKRSESLGKIEELPEIKKFRELKEKYVGLNDEQIKDIMKREGNID